MDSKVEPPRRGRPPGETTPEGLIRAELIAHLKLYKRIREIVERQIDTMGDNLAPEDLSKYMDLLRRGIVEMAKPIVPNAKAEQAKPEVEEDPEKILAGLLR